MPRKIKEIVTNSLWKRRHKNNKTILMMLHTYRTMVRRNREVFREILATNVSHLSVSIKIREVFTFMDVATATVLHVD